MKKVIYVLSLVLLVLGILVLTGAAGGIECGTPIGIGVPLMILGGVIMWLGVGLLMISLS